MPRNKVSMSITVEREKKVWKMRQRGATYERIAEEIGITFSGVHKILMRLHKRYREKNMDSIEAIRLEQIGELSHIADEAYQAWERSREPKKIFSTDGQEIEVKSNGDPRYMQVYMKAKEDIRKIVGADAPTKSEVSGKDGKPIQTETNHIFSNELMNARIDELLIAKKDDTKNG